MTTFHRWEDVKRELFGDEDIAHYCLYPVCSNPVDIAGYCSEECENQHAGYIEMMDRDC